MGRRKIILDLQYIIDVAYQITNSDRVTALTARHLSKQLGVSSMTIYNYVENIDEIKKEVIIKGYNILYRMMFSRIEKKRNSTLDIMTLCRIISLSMFEFARDNTGVFLLMFFEYGYRLPHNHEIKPFVNFYPHFCHRLNSEKASPDEISKTFYLFQIMIKALILEHIHHPQSFTKTEFCSLVDFYLKQIFGNNAIETDAAPPEKTVAQDTILSYDFGHFTRIAPSVGPNKSPDLKTKILKSLSRGMAPEDMIDCICRNDQTVEPNSIDDGFSDFYQHFSDWQARELDPIYTFIYINIVHFTPSAKNSSVHKSAVSITGINMHGQIDVLGIWVTAEFENNFWLSVFTDLKVRGIRDIFIACKFGASDFSAALQEVFPRTDIQVCVINHIRKSLRDVPWNDQKKIITDLKKIYLSPDGTDAIDSFQNLRDDLNESYPSVSRLWDEKFHDLTSFFRYPYEIRNVIYIINTNEVWHRQEEIVYKLQNCNLPNTVVARIAFILITNIKADKSLHIRDWDNCISQFATFFRGRLAVGA